MHIVTNDYKFAITDVPGVYHPFASARDCYSRNCTTAGKRGHFQIDISGTKFSLPQSIEYDFNYSHPECNRKLYNETMDENRQRLSAKCGGYCGDCKPAAHIIHVELIN